MGLACFADSQQTLSDILVPHLCQHPVGSQVQQFFASCLYIVLLPLYDIRVNLGLSLCENLATIVVAFSALQLVQFQPSSSTLTAHFSTLYLIFQASTGVAVIQLMWVDSMLWTVLL